MLDTESSCAMKRSGQHWSLTKKGRLFVASDPKKGETSGDHVLCHMLRQHSTLSAQHRFALQSSEDWHLCDRQVSSSNRLINAMAQDGVLLPPPAFAAEKDHRSDLMSFLVGRVV